MQIIMRQYSDLGNQLFRYAAGLYFAKQWNADLAMLVQPDVYSKRTGRPREFLLSRFPIAAAIRHVGKLDRLKLSTKPSLAPLSALVRKAFDVAIFEQPENYKFLPTLPLNCARQRVYLKGYWQAAGYAQNIENVLRETLIFPADMSDTNRYMLERIQSTGNAVSIHIRRGDYLLDSNKLAVLDPGYYKSAIQTAEVRIEKPTYFIFSDDHAYIRENFALGDRFVVVDHNSETAALDDLRLMAACKHHIIANSSFSWWAAWLGDHGGSDVFAPRHWTRHRPDFSDLFPKTWHLLDF